MPQQLRALAALPEDWGSIPSTNLVLTTNIKDSTPPSGLLHIRHTGGAKIYMKANTHVCYIDR